MDKRLGISDTLPEFKQIITFYRQKLDEINELIQQWKIQQYSANTRENKHRSRLNELNNFSRNIGQPTEIARTRYHIVVTTYAEFSTTGKIEVNYLVPNAGWIPALHVLNNIGGCKTGWFNTLRRKRH